MTGKEIVGVRLTWDKRYITLAPKATLLGLAFRLFDPDNHLGRGEDVGITLALIPTDHPGVEIGRRHLPAGAAFPNGPTCGRDVFVPLDWIIGGKERAGQGWRMLMACLAAGRSISLPATSAAAAKSMLRSSTAYARIRKQFNLPIGFMEGVEEPLARMVEMRLRARSRARRHRLDGVGRREARRHLGAAEICLDRAHAAKRQRRARHSRRPRHLRRAVELHPGRLSDGAGRHHRRRRQYPDAHADHLRPRGAAQPSLSLHRDRGAAGRRSRARARDVRPHLRRPCEPSPSPTPSAPCSTT